VLAGVALMVFILRISTCAQLTHRVPREQFPGRQLAAEVARLWDERFGTTLPIVTSGDWWMAGNVAYYSGSRPRVFTGEECLWMTEQDLLKQGGVFLWDASGKPAGWTPDECARWRAEGLPDPIVLNYQTAADVPPAVIGVAFVSPAVKAGLDEPSIASRRAEPSVRRVGYTTSFGTQ
jgi:hypothetical protein